jgi:signal transduction histidine kinase
LDRGRVGRELGWPDADENVAEAERALVRFREALEASAPESTGGSPLPATLSLVDRFDAVLTAGRDIASSLNRDAVYQSVWRAALRLLRGEWCAVWCLPPQGQSQPGADRVAPPIGGHAELPDGDQPVTADLVVAVAPSEGGGPAELRRMQPWAARAMRAGRTIVSSDQPDSASADDSDSGTFRSAICTPIFVRWEPVACFCVVHHQITAMFGEDEQRLAEFIAAIAGAALENAAGFEQLQRLNVSLEQHVTERTADLQARTTELARSNSDLEQFAYAASHDLQEPLRTVTGYCELLESRSGGDLSEEARKYIGCAVEASKRMKTLINDLLTYSRVGRRNEPFQITDCNVVLDQALANLGLALEETNATVNRGPLPKVAGDPTQLLQLFQNLIDNAMKFRSPQPPRIDVTAEDRGDHWQFSIRDNGLGISSDDHDRIFRIFHRLHAREQYPGTGIGLAICRKTVERHGGRIWVESETGKGSVFFFTLPVDPAGVPAAPGGPAVP